MTPDRVQEQKTAGFRKLRFSAELEALYQRDRDQAMRLRCRPVTASALALLVLYALLDLVMLPPELAQQTIAVRSFVTCPAILLAWGLSYRPVSADTFNLTYTAAYVAGGLSVVLIIALARLDRFPLPYEGVLLMLMFGYFVMGLTFRAASAASAAIIAAYLVMEAMVGTPHAVVVLNGVFLFTANVIGMVGSWLSEYRQRAHFLDRLLLDESRRFAEQENVRKTHLITAASHDLRQPLNVISLMLENLTPAPSSGEAVLLGRLKGSMAHFNSLLGSVLDISRLQQNMVQPEPRGLAACTVLDQLVRALEGDASRRGVELNCDPGDPGNGVLADPQLLHRILQNLVLNSLEHSGADAIELTARPVADCLRFEVRDNGRGLTSATMEKVFEPFFRTNNKARERQGLGLGLAIVKELTELMEGRCGVNNLETGGACFWVEMPAVIVANRGTGPRAVPGPGPGQHTPCGYAPQAE